MVKVEERLTQLGIELPTSSTPQYSYVPVVRTGNLVFMSGQISIAASGELIVGKVGRDISIDEACAAANRVAINMIATLKKELGDLDHVKRIVKLTGFVNCVDGFTKQPEVINATSDTLVKVFSDKGFHARSALGTNSLPFNVTVEVEAVVEVDPAAPSPAPAL